MNAPAATLTRPNFDVEAIRADFPIAREQFASAAAAAPTGSRRRARPWLAS